MKKIYSIIAILTLIFLAGCSTVKVTDAWKDDSLSGITKEKVLVIARTDDQVSRQRFEQEIAAALKGTGVNAVESYTKFPATIHNEKRSEEEIQKIVSIIKAEGFNVICLTVLRDASTEIVSSQTGGYTTGGYYPSHYGGYYGSFGGYYGSVYSPYGYGYGGTYVPAETRTYESTTYKIETTFYDLTREAGKQLVGVISTDVTDPKSAGKQAPEYGATIAKEVKAAQKR